MPKLEPVKIFHIDDLRKKKKRCPASQAQIYPNPWGDVDYIMAQCRLNRNHTNKHKTWNSKKGEINEW